MNLNIVETEYQSSIPIKGVCHKDFQNVAETFADPDCNLAFGYLVNKLGGEYLISERGQSLIDEAYKSLI